MRSIVVRPEAEVDIEDAADYTMEQWGRDQARRYIGDIRKAIDRLAIDGLRFPEETEAYPGITTDAQRTSLHLLSDRRRKGRCRPRDA